jgi:hypothetical protein
MRKTQVLQVFLGAFVRLSGAFEVCFILVYPRTA